MAHHIRPPARVRALESTLSSPVPRASAQPGRLAPPPEWDAAAALAWLNAKVNFERQPSRDLATRVLKLDRMHALSAALGDPHLSVPAIHVAGSKGKGSITRMAASILTAAGVRTGAFTSPHLITPKERIAVDRVPIGDADLARAIWGVAQAQDGLSTDLLDRFGEPTYFEAMTAAAFDHFAHARCQAAVYEVGLGGRLDSTNVLSPEVCVLASIELEHTDILGDTLELIAAEKAGILKPGVPAIATPQPPEVLEVFHKRAQEVGSPLHVLGHDVPFSYTTHDHHAMIDMTVGGRTFERLRSPLPGAHQAANTAAAVAACATFLTDHLTNEAVHDGLAATPREGRMEVIAHRPTIIIDGAHTPASVRAALAALPEHEGPLVIIFGCAKDKDAAGMLGHLKDTMARVIVTEAGARTASCTSLVERYEGEAVAVPNPAEALDTARRCAGTSGLIIALGSFMLAGAMKQLLAGS